MDQAWKIVVGHSTVVATEVTKIKSKLLPRLAVLLAVAVGLTAVAVTRSIGRFRERPPVTTPPATEPRQPRSSSQPNPSAAADQAQPAYTGVLGDFLVTAKVGQVADWPPCPEPRRPAQNYKASEVYSPVFGDLEVYECADGKIIGLSVYGDPSIGKRYFVGPAKVNYFAPLDRLVLLKVAGRPAIAQLPAPGDPEGLRLAVIQRVPSNNQPGIMVWIDNTSKSVAEAAALAAEIMGVRP